MLLFGNPAIAGTDCLAHGWAGRREGALLSLTLDRAEATPQVLKNINSTLRQIRLHRDSRQCLPSLCARGVGGAPHTPGRGTPAEVWSHDGGNEGFLNEFNGTAVLSDAETGFTWAIAPQTGNVLGKMTISFLSKWQAYLKTA